MTTTTSAIAITLALLIPGAAWAQKIEAFTPWEVGDSAAYKWSIGPKVIDVEETVVESTAAETKMTQRTADRSYELRIALPSMIQLTGPCLSNGQQCSFGSGVEGLQLPLEKGRKWNTAFMVTGETFTADVVQERIVEKVEKIKTPAGEFETWRIGFSASIKGKDAKGASFAGKESGTGWFAFPGGKPVLVKFAYRNSFGEKASRELVKLAYH